MSALEDDIKRVEAVLKDLEGNPGADGLVPGLKSHLERLKSLAEPKSVAEKRAEAGAPVGRSAAPRQTADAPTAPEEKAKPNTMVPDKAADVQGSGNVEVPKPESKG